MKHATYPWKNCRKFVWGTAVPLLKDALDRSRQECHDVCCKWSKFGIVTGANANNTVICLKGSRCNWTLTLITWSHLVKQTRSNSSKNKHKSSVQLPHSFYNNRFAKPAKIWPHSLACPHMVILLNASKSINISINSHSICQLNISLKFHFYYSIE